MSLAIDFTNIPRLLKNEFRLPAGDFLPTSLLRNSGESSPLSADDAHAAYFHQPSYRMPDCVSALGAALGQPLAGMFAPGLAQ